MTSFSEKDHDRLDWELLRYGAVTSYCRRKLFDDAIAWLKEAGYTVHIIDASTPVSFVTQMTATLRFKEKFGYDPWTGNLNALNDAFRDISFDNTTGVAFCFSRFDLLAKSEPVLAHGTLDIIELHSRDYLLGGMRLFSLVQSNDSEIPFDPIGCRVPAWNRQEWLKENRK